MFLNFSVMPLRVSGMLGTGLGALGGLGFLVILFEWAMGRTPEGYASLASAILLLAGVQLVMLGLIGEYLGRLFLTVNRKPQFVVREVHAPGAETERTRAAAIDTPVR
jgi:undecaprenyl-phosphate 4-deoxy-4-formamido-L-arabinose transferase